MHSNPRNIYAYISKPNENIFFYIRFWLVCQITETINQDMEWFQTEILAQIDDFEDILSKFLTMN